MTREERDALVAQFEAAFDHIEEAVAADDEDQVTALVEARGALIERLLAADRLYPMSETLRLRLQEREVALGAMIASYRDGVRKTLVKVHKAGHAARLYVKHS